MNNIFIIASVISVVYFIAKFIEMRHFDKENKPFKFLIRDSLLVYFSVICGYFILDQVSPLIKSDIGSNNVTPVFTDNPEF